MPELVTLETFDSAFAAHSAAAHLNEHGVSATVSDEQLTTMHPFLGFATVNIRLCVEESLVGEARKILAPFMEEQRRAARISYDAAEGGLPADGVEPDEDICLNCKADFPDDADACPACGWTFG
ncbi:MAG: hypothetical protein ACYTDX_06320 [Planctomycetota bacterium]|jgi:hypothetical protein